MQVFKQSTDDLISVILYTHIVPVHSRHNYAHDVIFDFTVRSKCQTLGSLENTSEHVTRWGSQILGGLDNLGEIFYFIRKYISRAEVFCQKYFAQEPLQDSSYACWNYFNDGLEMPNAGKDYF